MFRCTFAIIFLAALPLSAQEQPQIRLTLGDGSVIRGTVANSSVTVRTVYGDLTIPAGDVQSITFGLHLSTQDSDTLQNAIKRLRSDLHRERESAHKTLFSMGRRAMPALLLASSGSDSEATARAKALLQALTERGIEMPAVFDVVTAKEMTVKGIVLGEALKMRSEVLGELTVGLPDVREMLNIGATEAKFDLDAAKHGSEPAQWYDTGLMVSKQARLVITATGQVDLWPQAPAQYMATPQKPYNTAGKLSQFLSGSLLGKIGANGKVFFVAGETYSERHGEEGKLYLFINPAPWPNGAPTAGKYSVTARVKAE